MDRKILMSNSILITCILNNFGKDKLTRLKSFKNTFLFKYLYHSRGLRKFSNTELTEIHSIKLGNDEKIYSLCYVTIGNKKFIAIGVLSYVKFYNLSTYALAYELKVNQEGRCPIHRVVNIPGKRNKLNLLLVAGSGGVFIYNLAEYTLLRQISPLNQQFCTVVEYVGTSSVLFFYEDKNDLVLVTPELSNDDRLIEHHGDHIWAIKYVPYYNYVISGGCDNKIMLYNLTKNRTVQCYRGHTDKITCFVLLKEENFASSSYDFTVRIWSFTRRDCVRIIKNHTKWINWMASLGEKFLEDIIITCGSDKIMTFIDEVHDNIKQMSASSWVYRVAMIDDLYEDYFMVNIDGLNTLTFWKMLK